MKAINLRKLAHNFAQEKSKEERYWQKNDAKFRAVHQRCTNYDEFRQIVEAAHLRPLDRNETLTLERRSISWNQPAASPTLTQLSIKSDSFDTSQTNIMIKPKNTTQFVQQWRRTSNDMKLNYLRQLDNYDTLFQMDIPSDLVYDMSVLYGWDSLVTDAETIVNILCHLTQSKRFELLKTFMTSERQYQLNQLFARLSTHVHLRLLVRFLSGIYTSE
jgi:hypothetical protein